MNSVKIDGTFKLIVSFIPMLIGFVLLISYPWAWWALFLGSSISWLLIFGKEGLKVFGSPANKWTIFVGVIGYFIISLIISAIAKFIGLSWADNPVSNNLGAFIFKLPIMMMGEELFGIGILESLRIRGASLINSTLFSAIIFGLAHVFVYWDGSIFSTLTHVLMLQGVSRLIFNYIYIKTNSIWGSWASHILVDVIALSVGSI